MSKKWCLFLILICSAGWADYEITVPADGTEVTLTVGITGWYYIYAEGTWQQGDKKDKSSYDPE